MSDLKAINYVALINGGTAMLEVIGKRADVFTGDISEVLSYYEKGDIRILALLAPKRLKNSKVSRLPKSKAMMSSVLTGEDFMPPKGLSKKQYKEWSNIVKKVARSKDWATLREKNGLAPFESFGEDFEEFVDEQIELVSKISKDLGFMK